MVVQAALETMNAGKAETKPHATSGGLCLVESTSNESFAGKLQSAMLSKSEGGDSHNSLAAESQGPAMAGGKAVQPAKTLPVSVEQRLVFTGSAKVSEGVSEASAISRSFAGQNVASSNVALKAGELAWSVTPASEAVKLDPRGSRPDGPLANPDLLQHLSGNVPKPAEQAAIGSQVVKTIDIPGGAEKRREELKQAHKISGKSEKKSDVIHSREVSLQPAMGLSAGPPTLLALTPSASQRVDGRHVSQEAAKEIAGGLPVITPSAGGGIGTGDKVAAAPAAVQVPSAEEKEGAGGAQLAQASSVQGRAIGFAEVRPMPSIDGRTAGPVTGATSLSAISLSGVHTFSAGPVIASVNAKLSGGHEPTAHTAQARPLEAPAAYDHHVLMATPKRLEVGLAEGPQGWLRIRAEMGSGGTVNASLVAGTHAGAELLRNELPNLNAYLASEHSKVEVSVAPSFMAAAGYGTGSQGASQERGAERQHQRSTPQEDAPSSREGGWGSSQAAEGGTSALSVPLGAKVPGARWLSVRA